MNSDTGAIGQSRYLHDPRLAEAAFDNVRKDSTFLVAADKALKSVLAVKAGETEGKASINENDLTTPALTQPSPQAKSELNSAGKLAQLLGNLLVLLGDTSLSQMESRLATWQAMMVSQKEMGEQLSQQLQSALGEVEQATESYQAALDVLSSSKDVLDVASKMLSEAQASVDGLSPEDAGYAQAVAVRDQAAGEVTLAEQKVNEAEQQALNANTVAMAKTDNFDKILTQAQGLSLNSDIVQQSEKENLSSMGKLTMLMTMFLSLISKNNEESLQNDLATFKSLQEWRQVEMDKKSTEYQEEVRKADELNRVMGCLGKILGALLTLFSVIAAAFTGGASLALASIGVGLMVADEVVKAATGVSFIEEALKPLMDKILKPLMELIGKAISKVLQAFGVDKKTADMVGSIAGAILAAVAMVVVMIAVAAVGKEVAARMGDTLSKLLGDAIKKIVPDLLKELAQGGSKLLTQGVDRLTNALGQIGSKLGLETDALSKQLIANSLQRAALVGEVVDVGVQSGGGIAQGVFMKRASEAMADFSLAHAGMEQLQQWLKQAVEAFGENQKIAQELNQTLFATLQQNTDASRFVLRQSRA